MKRSYSDNEKASILAALDANGGNVNKTARQLKVAASTITDWSKNRKINVDVTDMRQVKKKGLAEKLEDLAHVLVDALHKSAANALLKDAVALGIAIDKMQLLKGQPTAINQSSTLTDEERAQRASELFEKARGRLKLAQ